MQKIKNIAAVDGHGSNERHLDESVPGAAGQSTIFRVPAERKHTALCNENKTLILLINFIHLPYAWTSLKVLLDPAGGFFYFFVKRTSGEDISRDPSHILDGRIWVKTENLKRSLRVRFPDNGLLSSEEQNVRQIIDRGSINLQIIDHVRADCDEQVAHLFHPVPTDGIDPFMMFFQFEWFGAVFVPNDHRPILQPSG
jgi:hypothetical protein